MKINAYCFAHLVKLLMDGTYNCKELAEETGLHYVTVLDYCKAMYKRRIVHIAAWEKDIRNRDTIMVYKLGKGKDAKRESLSHAQRQQRHRDKKKAMQMAEVLAGRAQFVKSANGLFRFEPIKEAA